MTALQSRMIIDFENVQGRVEEICASSDYQRLISKVSEAEEIFVIANGGLHYVGSHLATDCTRLIPNKTFHSFDSFGFITSAANDYGYTEVFVKWLSSFAGHKDMSKMMVLGMSCSGGSKNVVNAMKYINSQGGDSFLMAGADKLPEGLDGLKMNFDYFHTVEVACMFLLYELIHRVGGDCPSIAKENIRNVSSPLRV